MAKQEKLKSGATDYGRIYEQRIAAHLAIKCALNDEISDFWIVSNINSVGAFDDIVLMIQDREGNKKLYCIQLKHLENSNLQATLLEKHKPNNKFSLKKYQDSFEEIKENIAAKNVNIFEDISLEELYLILWTNAPLTARDKLQTINTESIGDMMLLTTSSDSNVYKVSNLPSSPQPFNEEFFERFYLFAKQASATSLDKIIKNELSSHFDEISNSVFICIIDYFSKWSMGDGKSIRRITKSDIQIMLLESFIVPHLFEPNEAQETIPEAFDLINETLTSFNITPMYETRLLNNVFNCGKEVLDKLYQSKLNLKLPWNTNLSDTHWNALKAFSDEINQKILKIIQAKASFVPNLTVRDIYLASWQCRIIPLIVNCNSSRNFIEKVLVKLKQVTKDLSFILFNPNTWSFSDNFTIFNNINDIEDVELKNNNMCKSFISLQGKKKINLEIFKESTSEVLKEVNPDVYLTLMESVIELGEKIEVEHYYVQRDLRRPLLKLSVLDENSLQKDQGYMFNQAGDLFVLVEFEGTLPLRYINKSMDLGRYIREKNYTEDEQVYILFTNLNDLDGDVVSAVAILHNETKKAVHVLKLKPGYLEWSFSEGTVETLQNHVVETNLLKEENSEHNIPEDDIIMRSRSSVNIISNNAGMGKTFMLKSLANKFEPDEWVCYINLSEHISKIPQNRLSYFTQIVDDAGTTKYARIQNFSTAVISHCVLSKKIIFLFDGYDEVSSEHALLFLKHGYDCGLRMWISTRPTYRKELEMRMGNLSIEITHFSSEDHVTFLWKYFQTYNHINRYDDAQIQYIIETINKCSSNLDKTLIAIPLQTRMFAEIFGDDINQISEKENLTIVDLYNKFVDVKLKEYKSYEATSLKKTLSKLALKLFFTEEQLENLIDFNELSEEAVTFQESYKKDSIVIGLNEKGDAVFGHQTFAEFLAAYWLTKQIVNWKGGYNLHWLPVIEKLYYVEMVPVRVFFDRILSQNLPLHMAVLNNDTENVRELLGKKKFQQDIDVLGRTALHVAVTYGKYYDLYVAREIKGIRQVGLHSIIQNTKNGYKLKIMFLEEKQYGISNEIIEELLNQGFVNTVDKLFRYDLFDYAMKSCSLNFIHSLFKRFEKVTLYFEIGYSFEIFLYCIVHDNLYHILSKRKVYNFDTLEPTGNKLRDMFVGYNFKLLKMLYNDMYLTEVAALNGSKEIILDLLQSGALGIEDGHVVHKACFGGKSDVLDLLHKMGADMNQLDESNWSPLYQAGMRGRSDLIYQFLMNSQLSTNKKNSTEMTPLHYAVQGGYEECVKRLLEFGAKTNLEDSYNNTPLSYACQYGHTSIIELILKSGTVDISDIRVRSAINTAAFHGYSDTVKKLLECGLDVNNLDEDGNTPLVIACKKGFSNVVSELANSKGCDLNLMVNSESLNSLQMWCAGNHHIMLHTKLFHIKCDRKQFGGITALHFATRHDHADCVKTLISLGANQYMDDEITKYPPLVWACMYGSEKVLKVLLASYDVEGSEKNKYSLQLGLLWLSMLGYDKCVEILCKYIEESKLDFSDEQNEPRIKELLKSEFMIEMWFIRENENMPLLIAAKNGYGNVIKTLLSLNYRNNYGLEEALYWAARNGNLECVKTLIAAGADDTRTNEKHLRLLPISWACLYRHAPVVEYLLCNKTSDFLQNKDLHVAINWAAVGGNYECLKMMLDFGLDADNHYPDLYGTPIINACEHQISMEVIDALIEKNCDLTVKNSKGFTVLEVAAGRRHFELVKRFISTGAFKDLKVEQGSGSFENLQLSLKWAVEKEEHQLVEELVKLGISVDNN